MSIFKGIEDAVVSRSGVYLEPISPFSEEEIPGHYVLDILMLKEHQSRKKQDAFIAEFNIIESDVPWRPAGSKASWYVNVSGHEAGLGNVKAFLAVVAGIEETDVDEEGARYAVSDDQPFEGIRVRCTAVPIETKKEKRDFTKMEWMPWSEDDGIAEIVPTTDRKRPVALQKAQEEAADAAAGKTPAAAPARIAPPPAKKPTVAAPAKKPAAAAPAKKSRWG